MGLFFKKKKLPGFPKLPEKPSFPEYRPQVPRPEQFRIKIPELRPEELEKQKRLDIPVRRPEMPRPRPVPPRELAPILPSSTGPQPLFVKIDRYKAAIKALNEIKERIAEAETTLVKLNAIKLRESDEIARWESEISNIKEKLLTIDKQLFEV